MISPFSSPEDSEQGRPARVVALARLFSLFAWAKARSRGLRLFVGGLGTHQGRPATRRVDAWHWKWGAAGSVFRWLRGHPAGGAGFAFGKGRGRLMVERGLIIRQGSV